MVMKIRLTPSLVAAFVLMGLICPILASGSAITADGAIESTAGGFVFPDGSVQTSAAVMTTGIPVRCVPARAGQTIASAEEEFFYCFAADGTVFDENQRVPTGYSLQVTDVVITATSAANGNVTSLNLYVAYETASRRYSISLMGPDTASYGEHFAVPYLILGPGDRLEGANTSASDSLRVHVSGVLVPDS